VGNLTDQFTMMSMDVDQERLRLDCLEEQVRRLESELDVERTARVRLTDTGDKDPNTHQAHAGYIGSTDNM